jgi:phosphonopyruvate decarboxylase
LCEASTSTVVSPKVGRREALRAIRSASSDDDIIIATTGYTGRELYACGDRPSQLYMVGSMGCASSFGLGLAIAQPNRRVIVIDGDGAALMRLGAMCTIGYQRPKNLTHVLLDNGIHESTGGQVTVSRSVNFCALAAASGYPSSTVASTPDELQHAISSSENQLTFIHVPIQPGVSKNLPRPEIRPDEVASRLRTFMQ